jgi:hypothetical protein
VGARFSAPVQTDPGAHPASCTMGTGYFPGVKSGRGMTLTLDPLLVPWSRKSKARPQLPLWAEWPVQSLSACTRVHFTFYHSLFTQKTYILHIRVFKRSCRGDALPRGCHVSKEDIPSPFTAVRLRNRSTSSCMPHI